MAEDRDPQDVWAPSISVSFDLIGRKLSGSLTSGDIRGLPLPDGCADDQGNQSPGELCPRGPSQDPVPMIGPPKRGSDTLVAPLMTASFELMTPVLARIAGAPRLFARTDLSFSAGFNRKLAGDSDPGPFREPPFLLDTQPIPEIGVLGQGSRAFAQLDTVTVSAGLGVALSTRIGGRTVRLKPSIEYLRERLKLRGKMHRAVAQVESAQDLSVFRFIALRDSSTMTLHGVGLGLEVEVDTARLGPVQTSMFLGGRGYRMLGDRERNMSATNDSFETASWRFEAEPWMWRGHSGIRFRWAPE